MLIILDVIIIFLVALRSVLFPYIFLFYITGTDSAKSNTHALLGTDIWFNQRQVGRRLESRRKGEDRVNSTSPLLQRYVCGSGCVSLWFQPPQMAPCISLGSLLDNSIVILMPTGGSESQLLVTTPHPWVTGEISRQFLGCLFSYFEFHFL